MALKEQTEQKSGKGEGREDGRLRSRSPVLSEVRM